MGPCAGSKCAACRICPASRCNPAGTASAEAAAWAEAGLLMGSLNSDAVTGYLPGKDFPLRGLPSTAGLYHSSWVSSMSTWPPVFSWFSRQPCKASNAE